MPIEHDCLNLCDQAVIAIQVRPPRLHHPDLRLREVVDDLHHPLTRRNKVGIEDRNKLTLRRLQPRIQRTRLVPIAICAVNVSHRLRVHPGKASRIPLDNLLRHDGRLVGRIVQYLTSKRSRGYSSLQHASISRSMTNCSLKIGS